MDNKIPACYKHLAINSKYYDPLEDNIPIDFGPPPK